MRSNVLDFQIIASFSANEYINRYMQCYIFTSYYYDNYIYSTYTFVDIILLDPVLLQKEIGLEANCFMSH